MEDAVIVISSSSTIYARTEENERITPPHHYFSASHLPAHARTRKEEEVRAMLHSSTLFFFPSMKSQQMGVWCGKWELREADDAYIHICMEVNQVMKLRECVNVCPDERSHGDERWGPLA